MIATPESGIKGEPQQLDLPSGALVFGPAMAFTYGFPRESDLAVGETREFPVISFGALGWRLSEGSYSAERLPDAEVAGPEDAKISARHYRLELKGPLGALRGESWIARDGRLIRSSLELPFGTTTTALK